MAPERRQELSSLSIPILHTSGRNFCTSSIGQRQGARLLDGISAWLSQAAHLRPRKVSASSRRYWSRTPYVFPDVLRTIVDANVHLLERVAHVIMSPLSNVWMLPATNRKPMNLIHGQATDVAQPESLCLCVSLLFNAL